MVQVFRPDVQLLKRNKDTPQFQGEESPLFPTPMPATFFCSSEDTVVAFRVHHAKESLRTATAKVGKNNSGGGGF